MATVQVWPRCSAPTPAGVPVKIRSPGAKVTSRDRWAMTPGTSQIIIDSLVCCRMIPSTVKASVASGSVAPRMLSGGRLVLGVYGKTGANADTIGLVELN